MPPKVKVSVSFVPTKNPLKHQLKIHNPVNLTEQIGLFDLADFAGLKAALSDVVEDRSFNLFFHHDSKHTYRFEEQRFENGAIFGRKQKKCKEEEAGMKVTAGRLLPIQSPTQFQQHVKDIAEVVHKPSSSSTTRSKRSKKSSKSKENKIVDYYIVELCVIILQEKIPVQTNIKKSIIICCSNRSNHIYYYCQFFFQFNFI